MKSLYILLFLSTFCHLQISAQNARIDSLQQIQEKLKDQKNTLKYQQVLFDLGLAYDGVDIKKVAEFAEELKNCSFAEVKDFAHIRGCLLDARNGFNLGKPSQAFNAVNKALTIANGQNDSLGIGIAHLQLGLYYALSYQTDKLKEHGQKAVDILEGKDEVWCIKALIFMSNYWALNGNLARKIKLLDSLVQLSVVKNNPSLEFRINLSLALAYSINVNFEKGASHLHQADLFLKENFYPSDHALFYKVKADFYWRDQPEEAISTAEKGFDIAKKYGFKYEEIRARNALGYYYKETGVFDKSEKLLRENMNYCEQEKITSLYIISWLFLASNYRLQGEKELALNELLTLLKFCETNKTWSVIPSALTELSKLSEFGQDKEIDRIFDKYVGFEEKFSSEYNKKRLLKIAQKRAERMGDASKALAISKRRIELLNTYMVNSNSTKYIELEAAYQNKIMQNEISNKAKALKLKNKYQAILIGICGVLLASLFLVCYLIYRRKQYLSVLKNQNEFLKYQRQEIDLLNSELSQKNEVLAERIKIQGQDLLEYILLSEKREEQINSLEKTLEKMKVNFSQKINSDIKILEQKIENIKLESDDWVTFKQKFNQVHPNFIDNVLTVHSTLTKRELKHCMYLKLNLPSKKIAEIMFISPKSVETARYRIKKKLGLSAKDDMKEYLNSISL